MINVSNQFYYFHKGKLINFWMLTISQNLIAPYQVCSNVPEKYRKYDGSCNNLKNPKLGWAHTPYQRILPNAYPDR